MVELSIIIPTLNEEKYLPYLLNSIKKQDYKDYEIIVSDGFSNDKTVKIAKRYGCNVIINNKRNISYQRNKGAKIAKGNFLLFLDADMILPNKNFLDTIIKKYIKNNLKAVSFNLKPSSNKLKHKINFYFSNVFMIIIDSMRPVVFGGCVLTNKSNHNKVNGFNTELFLGEDCNYSKKMSEIGKVKLFATPRIITSVRRIEKEGPVKLGIKYIKSSFYILINKDPKNWNIEYNYGHYNKDS